MRHYLNDTIVAEIPVPVVFWAGIGLGLLLIIVARWNWLAGHRARKKWYDEHWLQYVEWRTRDTFHDMREQITKQGRHIRSLEDENTKMARERAMMRAVLASDWRVVEADNGSTERLG